MNIKKTFFVILCIALIAVLLAGCETSVGGTPSSKGITINHLNYSPDTLTDSEILIARPPPGLV